MRTVMGQVVRANMPVFNSQTSMLDIVVCIHRLACLSMEKGRLCSNYKYLDYHGTSSVCN